MSDKKKAIKKEMAQWVLMLAIFGILFFTGIGREITGGLQSLVISTGLFSPNVDKVERIASAEFGFSLNSLDGQELDFESLKGKTVFLNLWATWCPPCRAEMPDIQGLYKEVNSEDIVFVMLSMDDSPQKAKKYIEDKGFTFPVYQANSGLPSVFQSRSIPTTFVINPEGEIVLKNVGIASYNTDSFKRFLQKL